MSNNGLTRGSCRVFFLVLFEAWCVGVMLGLGLLGFYVF